MINGKLRELISFPLSDLVAGVHELRKRGKKDMATMLGIGPMSPTVIRAAIELGRDAEFPVMLIASRNQVDVGELGGGYVMGWDQAAFCEAIGQMADDAGFDGLLYICRDHGGPWQRDKEKNDKFQPDKAIELGMKSFTADLDAGFNVLHIDPTKDPHPDASPEKVKERTVAMLDDLEAYRKSRGYVAVGCEVGTEDIVGGHTSNQAFGGFLKDLLDIIKHKNLPRPSFVVGQTGTLVKMAENVGTFDPDTARALAHIAAEMGVGFKEHNCDYVDLGVLEAHPLLGITASNVAPEFGVAETRKLLELAEEEKVQAPGTDVAPSNFIEVLTQASLESGRWIKWMKNRDQGMTAEKIKNDHQMLRYVTEVAGHYLFDDPAVKSEREKLFKNLKTLGIATDPQSDVIDAVKESIKRYVEAFNLAELTPKIRALKGS